MGTGETGHAGFRQTPSKKRMENILDLLILLRPGLAVLWDGVKVT
jgi:hypothetical protein